VNSLVYDVVFKVSLHWSKALPTTPTRAWVMTGHMPTELPRPHNNTACSIP